MESWCPPQGPHPQRSKLASRPAQPHFQVGPTQKLPFPLNPTPCSFFRFANGLAKLLHPTPHPTHPPTCGLACDCPTPAGAPTCGVRGGSGASGSDSPAVGGPKEPTQLPQGTSFQNSSSPKEGDAVPRPTAIPGPRPPACTPAPATALASPFPVWEHTPSADARGASHGAPWAGAGHSTGPAPASAGTQAANVMFPQPSLFPGAPTHHAVQAAGTVQVPAPAHGLPSGPVHVLMPQDHTGAAGGVASDGPWSVHPTFFFFFSYT